MEGHETPSSTWRSIRRAAVGLCAALAAMAIAAPVASSSPATATRVEIFGSSLHDPSSMALDGPNLFVAQGASVVEVDATGGFLVRRIAGPAYQFSARPGPMLVVGGELFVADYDSVTEIDTASGALVRVLPNPTYELLGTAAMASVGPDLFIASRYGGRGHYGVVTEVDVATGALVRVLAGSSRDPFAGPDALATVGPDLFVASTHAGPTGAGSVSEFDASTGALVRVIAGPRFFFVDPDSLTAAGDDLFVGSETGARVTELDAASGDLVRVLAISKQDAYNVDAASGNDLAVVGDDLVVGTESPGTYDCSAITEVDLSASQMWQVRLIDTPIDTVAPCQMLAQGSNVLVAGRDGVLVDDASLGFVDAVLGGEDIDDPTALAIDGPDLFVTGEGSLTELDASTGEPIRVMFRRPYDFDQPDALAIVGDDLFVAEDADEKGLNRLDVVELNVSTGALVRTVPAWSGRAPVPLESANVIGALGLALYGADLFISEASFQVFPHPGAKPREPSQPPGGWIERFDTSSGALSSFAPGRDQYPALTVAAGKLFVATVDAATLSGDDRVLELDASTGKQIEALGAAGYRWSYPDNFVVSGPDVFVVNRGDLASHASGSITELDAASGAVVRTISGRRCAYPEAIAASAGEVFVTCQGTDVVELDAATGAVVRVFAGPRYGLDGPQAIAVAAGRVYVANVGNATISEFPIPPGSL